ncbi:MAG: hypothetical protein JWN08_1457 [Frankiales bacterium]|jgi:hypothetical protein|nr:hypothetical protein [Frankiales bacterium]
MRLKTVPGPHSSSGFAGLPLAHTAPMDSATITTCSGVLRIVVVRRGRSWVARLAPEHVELLVPPCVGPDRDAAVRSLTWAVRSLSDLGAAPGASRPGSWAGCG